MTAYAQSLGGGDNDSPGLGGNEGLSTGGGGDGLHLGNNPATDYTVIGIAVVIALAVGFFIGRRSK